MEKPNSLVDKEKDNKLKDLRLGDQSTTGRKKFKEENWCEKNIRVFSFRHAEFEMVVGYAKGEKVRRIQKRKALSIVRRIHE